MKKSSSKYLLLCWNVKCFQIVFFRVDCWLVFFRVASVRWYCVYLLVFFSRLSKNDMKDISHRKRRENTTVWPPSSICDLMRFHVERWYIYFVVILVGFFGTGARCLCVFLHWVVFFLENLACHQFDIKRVAFRSRKTGFPRIDNGLVGTFLVSYYALSLSLLLSFLPVLSRYNIMYSWFF